MIRWPLFVQGGDQEKKRIVFTAVGMDEGEENASERWRGVKGKAMSQIRDDFVDPEIVWDPELFPPIPRIIGNLLGLVLVFGFSAVALGLSRAWFIVTLVGVFYFLANLVTAIQRLRAYLHYEAWLASPEPPPSHTAARIFGAALLAIVAVEFVFCCMAWFAR